MMGSVDLMKCCKLDHFIWVFNVCQCTRLWFYSIQRVKYCICKILEINLLIDCGELDHPTNGYVNTSQGTISGDSAHYDCNAGYTRSGPEMRVCNGTNGVWQPEQPACIKGL